jgi:hypothetical protein
MASSGFVARLGAAIQIFRHITAGAGITVTNPSGADGDVVISAASGPSPESFMLMGG